VLWLVCVSVCGVDRGDVYTDVVEICVFYFLSSSFLSSFLLFFFFSSFSLLSTFTEGYSDLLKFYTMIRDMFVGGNVGGVLLCVTKPKGW